MFLSVSSQFCRWLPSDPFSRRRPCLKLVVSVSRVYKLTIWTLVLLQRTCTSRVHAHAGRTLLIAADGRNTRAVLLTVLATAKLDNVGQQSLQSKMNTFIVFVHDRNWVASVL
jgi:hypothetical protein